MQLPIASIGSDRASLAEYITDKIINERPTRATFSPAVRMADTDRPNRICAGPASFVGRLRRTTRPPWPEAFPKVLISTSIAKLKAHPDYTAAKWGGDAEAGRRVVRDLFKPASIVLLPRAAIVAPVVLREAASLNFNMLPIALAERVAMVSRGVLQTDIVQTNVAGHTELNLAQRSLHRPVFAGAVESHAKYILVDDVVTSGATLAELAAFIRRRGGDIVGIVSLAAGYGSTTLAVRSGTLSALRSKHGSIEGTFIEAFGYGFGALTEREARNLIGLDTAGINGRIVARSTICETSPEMPNNRRGVEPRYGRARTVQELEGRTGLCGGFVGREKDSGRPVAENPYG